MKHLIAVLALTSLGLAQCPLGFAPEEACSAENPSCGLFVDANGDNLCDNPGPQPVEENPEPEPEPEPEETAEQDPFCPLGYTPEEACYENAPGCALFADGNGDSRCDNPGPQPVAEQEEPVEPPPPVEDTAEEATPPELTGPNPEESSVPEEEPWLQEDSPVIEAAEETADDTTEDEPNSYACPLQFTPEEACSEENPKCALYTDADNNRRCDNPGISAPPEELHSVEIPSVMGCPLGLSPENACPDSLALCPHWYGVSTGINCANPSGGRRRTNIILITLAFLLSVSAVLSRRFYGKRLKDRLNRNTAHHVVRGISLMVLGFGVQGCYCPLGAFQYAFTSGGLAFLGLGGLVILLLPFVFSAFFGRVFCGWVCPIGALQEFLYRIHVPGRISPSGRIHKKLRYLSHVVLFSLIAVILLNRYGVVSLDWRAPFCQVDPFHTMFTLFLSGSLVVAGVTIVLAVFLRRFFCRYLCFYGAALSLFARLRLWNRLTGKKEAVPEMDSDEEFDR